jgi:autotransporter-associated beta strand protein
LGGFGAQNGFLELGDTPCGGSGLGAGGAVFARLGTTLSVEDCSFAGDTVSSAASAIGAALFLGGNLTYSVSSGTNMLAETIGGGNDPNAEGGLTKAGAGTLVLTATNSFVGNTTVNAGTLRVVNNVLGSSTITIASNAVFEYNYTDELAEAPTTYNGAGTLRISGNGEVIFGPGAINVDFSPGALIDVQGGKLFGSSGYAGIWTANQSSLNLAAGSEFDAVESGPSGTMQIDALTGAGTFLGGYSGNNGALTTVTIGVAGGGGTFSGTLQDEVSSHLGLIKTGAGIETFSGNNTYTGGTTVNAGTLDINGNNGPGYIIASGGILGGTGTIGGPVSIGSAGTLSPGAPVGTLTITNNLSLAGNTLVALNAGANSRVAGLASVTFGGTLTITNLGGPLVFGSHYTLFSAASYFGNFSNIVGNPGPGLAYSFNPTNGVLSVISTLPTAPTGLVFHTSSGQIQLSWPASYTGWILQTQTNSISTGLGTNWVDVPNTALVDATNISLSPENCIFFRLRYP